MSQELDIRMWYEDEGRNVHSRFLDLVSIVSQKGGMWTSVFWEQGNAEKGSKSFESDLNSEDFMKFIDTLELKGDDYRLTGVSTFPCWKFDNGKPEMGTVVLSVSTWSSNYKNWMWDQHYEGHGAITLFKPSPFFGISDPEGKEGLNKSKNNLIEENLMSLLEFLQEFSRQIRPKKWLANSTGENPYNPFNSHIAYYDSLKSMLCDLEFWNKVLLHENPLQNSSLINKESIIKIHKYIDVIEEEYGMTFLHFPFFMNGLLDEAFLKLSTGQE